MKLKTFPDDLVQGNGFKNLMDGFYDIVNNKADQGCKKLAMTMRELFDANIDFKVIDTSGEYKFFGFRAYPKQLLDDPNPPIIDTIGVGDDPLANQWLNSPNWIIEIDGKIKRDYNMRLSPADVTYLFIFFIEYNLLNGSLYSRAIMLYKQIFCQDKMDYRVMKMIESKPTNRIKALIVLQRCNWVNFLTELPKESIMYNNGSAMAGYKQAIGSLITTYGTTQLVNRRIDEYDREITGIIELIYDGVNDLRYSAFRFRKNLAVRINAMNSPTVKKVLIDIYRAFNESINTVFAQESAQEGYLPKMKKNPEQIAIERANIDNYWKNKWKDVIEASTYEYIDNHGFAMKADKREIDELRVRVQSIDSVNDKIFLLERLHKQYGIIDNALAMLGNPRDAHKVKQTKTELLKYKADLDMIREMIFKAPSGRMKFGLFVQYPEGYEG